ncbi:MAG: M55 family metallopeptidase [Pseudomonadota bacterium]
MSEPSTDRLFISADIEGLAHVVTPAQTLTDGVEWAQARNWMSDDTASVAGAALNAGMAEVIVADSHLRGENIVPERLPANTLLLRSWPRPLGMMQGVDRPGVRGAVLLGYHTASHHSDGVLNHTLHGGMIARLWINEEPASETLLSVLLANYFGVPVILAVGDDAYCRYVDASYHGIETCCTKESLGRFSALALPPEQVRGLLSDSVAVCVGRLRDEARQPAALQQTAIDPTAALTVRIEVKHSITAELMAYLPTVTRIDGLTAQWRSADIVEVSRMLQFLTHYQPVP